MKSSIHSTFQSVLLVLVLALPLMFHPVNAQLTGGVLTAAECAKLGIKCASGNTTSTIASTMITIINAFLILTATIALIALVISAFLYITSRGNEDNIKKAKNGFIFALIGLFIIGMAGLLVNVVINL